MNKKRRAVIVLGITVLLGAGIFAAFTANDSDDTVYFPFKTGNQWTYQITFPDNSTAQQDLVVDKPDNGNLKLMIYGDGSPMAQLFFFRNDRGLFKFKEITAKGVNKHDPAKLILASRLDVGAAWFWQSKLDSKAKFSAKVIEKSKITVPAGTFDTILVRTEGVYEDGNEYIDDTWFAKDIGQVKSVVTIKGVKRIDELVKYKLAK